MNASAFPTSTSQHGVRLLAHLDLPGAGQIVVKGHYAYVGHMKPPHGTTILDIAEPRAPRIVAQIKLADERSHTHKVRVNGDVMITNVEQNNRHAARRAQQLTSQRAALTESLGRTPTAAELAAALQVAIDDLPQLESLAGAPPYEDGGFRLYDIADRTRPRLLHEEKTFGIGVHRFDADAHYAYISTEMEGYVGNILVIYALDDPARPAEVARWWLPGQHVAGGETPGWSGTGHRLHHALRFGDRLWAGCWQAGLRIIDVADIRAPRTIGAANYHPPFREPTHTVLPVPFAVNGRHFAVVADEEHGHTRGQPPACLWVFDVTDLADIHAVSQFHVSELDSPWTRVPAARFGLHQFCEHMDDTRVYCAWFSGGLRVVDVCNPLAPEECAWFIPEPCGGNAAPQSNDVDVDARGLVYLVDRNCGFDVLELTR